MQDLPTEVWRLVFDDLSRRDLCTVCLASRQLQALAQPHLFSNIEYNWVNPDALEIYGADLEPPLKVASLVRALHRRPELAEAVRNVSLLCSRSNKYQEKVKIKDADDDFKDLVQAAGQLNLPFATSLSQAVSDGDLDAFVTLLLALTPRITHLKLTEEFASKTRMLSRLILYTSQHPESPASSLKRLSHVQYISYHNHSRAHLIINTDDVTPFFYLPGIQSLSADIQEPAKFTWPLPAPPTTATLTHLALTRTREKTLSILLEHTKSLKYLEWVWIYDGVNFGYQNQPVMDLDSICEALEQVRTTLTTLKLRGCTQINVTDPKVNLTGSMRGLTKMDALTTLETTLQFFMGFKRTDYTVPLHECLPPTIQKVCFTDDFCYHEKLRWTGRDQTKMVETWWKVKDNHTPNLEVLELRTTESSFHYKFWPDEDIKRLAKLAERHGVTLKLYTSQLDRRWFLDE